MTGFLAPRPNYLAAPIHLLIFPLRFSLRTFHFFIAGRNLESPLSAGRDTRCLKLFDRQDQLLPGVWFHWPCPCLYHSIIAKGPKNAVPNNRGATKVAITLFPIC